MSTVSSPRGPLPPRVYWTRRVLVLGVALAMVFGIGRLLGGSPDPSENDSARPASADASTPAAGRTASDGATGDAAPAGTNSEKKVKAKKTKTPLAVPTGPCADDDIVASPTVDGRAYAGQDVTITLNLRAASSPACSWEVSPDSVVVKLTSGSDRIWSTQDCPAAIDTAPVVVRKDHTTKVEVTWSGQRSDDECSRTTLWAQPGYYHVGAAALGAEPQNEQFELLTPTAPTITATPKVKKKPKKQD